MKYGSEIRGEQRYLAVSVANRYQLGFDFDKGIDDGTMYWTIEGGMSGTGESTIHTFALPGRYEVCLYAACDDNNVVECITVDATSCDNFCDAIPFTSNSMKCPSENNGTINVTLDLEDGIGPCGGELFFASDGVNYYDYYFNEDTDHLSISMNVDDPTVGYPLVLCDENGGTYCFLINVTSSNETECTSCQPASQTSPSTAICTDTNLSDLNFNYSGTILLSDIPANAVPCGGTSASGGYSQGTPVNLGGGNYRIPYTINTNNPNPFNTEATICFMVLDVKHCFKVSISVPNPCEIEGCIEVENQTIIECKDVDGNGNALFDIEHILFLPMIFRDGYELCQGREVSINSGTVILNGHNPSPDNGYGYVTNTTLSIPCEDLVRTGQSVLTLNFCKGNEEICVDLTFNLDCPGCPSNRKPQIDKSVRSNSNYNVYPNPTKDFINIDLLINSNDQYYKLYDVVNRHILSDKLDYGTNKISTLNIPPGIYNLEIVIDDESYIEKIIIID